MTENPLQNHRKMKQSTVIPVTNVLIIDKNSCSVEGGSESTANRTCFASTQLKINIILSCSSTHSGSSRTFPATIITGHVTRVWDSFMLT